MFLLSLVEGWRKGVLTESSLRMEKRRTYFKDREEMYLLNTESSLTINKKVYSLSLILEAILYVASYSTSEKTTTLINIPTCKQQHRNHVRLSPPAKRRVKHR